MNKICTFFYSSGILIYLYLKYLFLGQFSINIRLCIIGKFSPSNLISISSQPCQTKPNPTAEKMFKNLPTSRELCFILYFIICTDKEPKSKQKSTLPLICEIGRIGWVAQKKPRCFTFVWRGPKSMLRKVSAEVSIWRRSCAFQNRCPPLPPLNCPDAMRVCMFVSMCCCAILSLSLCV